MLGLNIILGGQNVCDFGLDIKCPFYLIFISDILSIFCSDKKYHFICPVDICKSS